MRRLACWLLALLATLSVQAVEVRQFDDPAKQARYERLIEELRCLVCQNQSLADSDADLARDLRDEVYGIIQSGKDEQEAIRFLTDRYGDFVLYRPPVKPITWLLWIGPLLILLGGGLFLWRRHAHRRLAIDDGMTEAERLRLEKLKSELLHKDES
jgi:cytochrome c-type biogenesis protein CcmH